MVISFLFPYHVRDLDILEHTETEKSIDYEAAARSETGWDRVKRMFEADEFGNITPEFNTILQTGAMSAFVGAVYGGFIDGRIAYINFMKNNQATAFESHLEAKKKLQEKVTTAFGKGAFKWSWRLTAFTTTYAGVSTVISVYRGKASVMEHVIGGFVSGTLYKFNMGPRGWIVGGGLGGVLGLFAGLCTMGLLSLTGMSIEETRYWNYHWKHQRDESLRKQYMEYTEEKSNSPFRHYNLKVDKEKDKLNLDSVENNK